MVIHIRPVSDVVFFKMLDAGLPDQASVSVSSSYLLCVNGQNDVVVSVSVLDALPSSLAPHMLIQPQPSCFPT